MVPVQRKNTIAAGFVEISVLRFGTPVVVGLQPVVGLSWNRPAGEFIFALPLDYPPDE
jgi:hypothetical protein